MEIRHVHARSDRAALFRLGREIVDVIDLQLVTREQPQRWSVWLTMEVKGVLSVTCNGSAQG